MDRFDDVVIKSTKILQVKLNYGENFSDFNSIFISSRVRTRLHTAKAGSPDTIQKVIVIKK